MTTMEQPRRPTKRPPERLTALIYCTVVACGRPFWVTARQARHIRTGERSGRCPACIRHESVTIQVTTPMLAYWRSRFSDEEILELAEAMWGPRESWSREDSGPGPGVP